MNACTLANLLASFMVELPNLNAAEQLKTAIDLDDALSKPEMIASVVKYYDKHRKLLDGDVADETFVTRVDALAQEYQDYTAFRALFEALEAPAPIYTSTVTDGLRHVSTARCLCAEDLDEIKAGGCGDPNCTVDHSTVPLPMLPSCHPRMAMSVVYDKGELTMYCSLCKNFVTSVKVANR